MHVMYAYVLNKGVQRKGESSLSAITALCYLAMLTRKSVVS